MVVFTHGFNGGPHIAELFDEDLEMSVLSALLLGSASEAKSICYRVPDHKMTISNLYKHRISQSRNWP